MTREEIIRLCNETIDKANEDPKLKEELLKDGNKAVLEATGENLPIKFTVHESDEKHIVLILPETTSGELDDSELSKVSGGAPGGQNQIIVQQFGGNAVATIPTAVANYGMYKLRVDSDTDKSDVRFAFNIS